MGEATGDILKAAAAIAVAVAIKAAASALARSALPDPESAKQPIRQPIPPKQVGYGECRMSGPYLYWATRRGWTVDVIALCDESAPGVPVEGITFVYLNDDKLTPQEGSAPLSINSNGEVRRGEDGRYGAASVFVNWRLGDTPQTAIDDVIERSDGEWTENHRADGTCILSVTCVSVQSDRQNTVYPNGAVLPSAVGRWVKVYDWRADDTAGGSGTQRRDDPSTWQWSKNPVVCLVHDEWHRRGQDWAYRFAPTLDRLTTAADVCDEAIPLDAGGTEPRYEMSGFYLLNNPPKDIRAKFLQTFDGLLIERGDGAFVIVAGKYEEPTVTLNEDRILEFSWRRTSRREDVANVLVGSFNSPAHGYTMIEGEPWVDAAGVIALGYEIRDTVPLEWVTSWTQQRRLLKREMSRRRAAYAGHILISLSDEEEELEQRWFRIQNRKAPPSMWDAVVEVTAITLDLASRLVRIEIISADPDIDDWDPATEEGAAPGDPPTIPPETIEVPEILDIDVIADSSGVGGSGARLRVTVAEPTNPNVQFIIGWREAGTQSFAETAPLTGEDEGTSPAGLTVVTGFVPVGISVEVVAWTLAGAGRSDPSDIETVSTTLDTVPPASPTEVDASDLGTSPSAAHVTWRNPTSGNFAYAKVFRANVNNFAMAAAVSGNLPGGLGEVITDDFTTAAGNWWFWVVAYNASAVPSVPGGPAAVTIA